MITSGSSISDIWDIEGASVCNVLANHGARTIELPVMKGSMSTVYAPLAGVRSPEEGFSNGEKVKRKELSALRCRTSKLIVSIVKAPSLSQHIARLVWAQYMYEEEVSTAIVVSRHEMRSVRESDIPRSTAVILQQRPRIPRSWEVQGIAVRTFTRGRALSWSNFSRVWEALAEPVEPVHGSPGQAPRFSSGGCLRGGRCSLAPLHF